jgi:hypothetical protein
MIEIDKGSYKHILYRSLDETWEIRSNGVNAVYFGPDFKKLSKRQRDKVKSEIFKNSRKAPTIAKALIQFMCYVSERETKCQMN